MLVLFALNLCKLWKSSNHQQGTPKYILFIKFIWVSNKIQIFKGIKMGRSSYVIDVYHRSFD